MLQIREITDTQQLPVLTHAFAVMLSSVEGARKDEEVRVAGIEPPR